MTFRGNAVQNQMWCYTPSTNKWNKKECLITGNHAQIWLVILSIAIAYFTEIRIFSFSFHFLFSASHLILTFTFLNGILSFKLILLQWLADLLYIVIINCYCAKQKVIFEIHWGMKTMWKMTNDYIAKCFFKITEIIHKTINDYHYLHIECISCLPKNIFSALFKVEAAMEWCCWITRLLCAVDTMFMGSFNHVWIPSWNQWSVTTSPQRSGHLYVPCHMECLMQVLSVRLLN